MTIKEEIDGWYLYMIRTAGGALYTGITKDVERRMKEHSAGGARGARSLRGKGPLRLVLSKPAGSHGQALKVEYRVKQLTKKKKEQLILLPEQLDQLITDCISAQDS